MSNEKSIVKKANTQVATVNLEQFENQGFENVGSKDLALPFLKSSWSIITASNCR